MKRNRGRDERLSGLAVRYPTVAPGETVVVPGGGSGVGMVRLKVLEPTQYPDSILCEKANDPGQRIHVAKPWRLQRTPWDNIERNGFLYTYSSNTSRTVSMLSTSPPRSMSQIIVPLWEVGEEIFAARGVEGGTGAVVERAGDEKLIDGTFLDPGSWVLDANGGWGFAGLGGAVHIAGAGSGRITQKDALFTGSRYVVRFIIAGASGVGGVRAVLGSSLGTTRTADGDYSELVTCEGGLDFAFLADGGWGGTITFASVQATADAETPWLEISTQRAWVGNL